MYDARRRCARLAREVWKDDVLAEKLERQADELKRSFNEDFWLARLFSGWGVHTMAEGDGGYNPIG